MSLRDRLDADLKAALKGGERVRLETIRGVRGAIRNKEIEVGGTLDDDAILRVIRALVKQREEAIESYRSGGRADLVAKEEAERAVLAAYLPQGPGAGELERVVREVIAEVGASGPRDLGRVMRPALERLGPLADGKAVNEVARRLLSGGGA